MSTYSCSRKMILCGLVLLINMNKTVRGEFDIFLNFYIGYGYANLNHYVQIFNGFVLSLVNFEPFPMEAPIPISQ